MRLLAGAKQRALLAILLVHRGQVVTTERLVEELWAGRPPARPEKTLHVYVSQLRRVLGNGQPLRRGGGYVLEIADADVDAGIFEQLLEQGGERRANCEFEAADDALTAALELWRGPALADFAYDDFAQTEISRLEELRLVALEERAETALARGRHVEVVAELEALARDHPLRERLVGALMLALYRSGRQADALAAFTATRRRLADELGLEPGRELQDLQRRILNHDEMLGATSADDWLARVPIVGPDRRAAALLVIGSAIALAVAAAVVFVEVRTGAGRVRLGSVAPDSVAVIDPDENAIVAGIPVGAAPTAVAVAGDTVWVANAGDRSVTRIDAAARRSITSVRLNSIPSQLVADERGVWVASPFGEVGTVMRIDAQTRATSATPVRVGDEGDLFAPPTPTAIAAGAGGIWVNHVREQVAFVRPGLPRRVRQIDLGASHSSDALAVGEGAVWVASSADDSVLRIDPRTGVVVADVPIVAAPRGRVAGPSAVAVGYGAVWVADTLANAVTRIDPTRNETTAMVGVGVRPTRLAVGEGAVWVLNAGDGTVSRIDPRTTEVRAVIPVGPGATSIAAGGGAVWTTVAGRRPQALAGRRQAPMKPLTTVSCSAPVGVGDGADFVVVSDLPSGPTADMRRAIRFVLARHRFRAGRYRVAYQACDASATAEAQSSPERCAANARAYAGNPSVIGVVGTYHSFCAAIELPILNAAPGGPVAMISPTNTYVGLTHGGPGTTATEPERYYPTGTRNYARVIAPDDAQGAALAVLAKQLGAKRLYLLHDNQGTGYGIAKYVETGARRLGLDVVGISAWDADTPDQKRTAEAVARAKPDAVVLGGCVCENGFALIEALRSALGPQTELLAPDTFTPSDAEYTEIAGAAAGLYITEPGVALARLPTAGRRFLAAFARDRRLQGIDPYVVYAAQATEVLVDAIARSNGTRPSVAEEVLATRMNRGLIGSFGFDANGDPTRAPVSVFRIDFSADHAEVIGGVPTPGATFDRVITPPPRLVD